MKMLSEKKEKKTIKFRCNLISNVQDHFSEKQALMKVLDVLGYNTFLIEYSNNNNNYY